MLIVAMRTMTIEPVATDSNQTQQSIFNLPEHNLYAPTDLQPARGAAYVADRRGLAGPSVSASLQFGWAQ
jgi:hypothetical protein